MLKSLNSTFLSASLFGSAMATALVVTAPIALVTQSVQAATPADNLTAATRLNALLKNISSMRANFSQTTTGSGSGNFSSRNGTFSGSMSVQRPNNFRWDTKSPSEQLIVGNSNSLWVYDKDLEQATRQDPSDQIGNTPALLLSGEPSKIAENFRITQPDASKNYYVLYPKSTDSNFESLEISFSGGKPVMMVLKDSLGQVTSIRFSSVSINPSIASSQFSFTPPAGIDVIEQ